MSNLVNATPFGATVMPSADCDGRDLLLTVVAATFRLPAADTDNALEIAEATTPPMADEFIGAPGLSSLLRDGQSCYSKPATDIWVTGTAAAPACEPTRRMDVGIRVGPCILTFQVFGDRVWERDGVGGARPSDPVPFTTMPLVWERAFGGLASGAPVDQPVWDARNPVGCGLEVTASSATGKRLPNIEDFRTPLRAPGERPEPVGVAPVARHWQPRVSFAGTYDQEWRRQRAPLWPVDFDERFFCSAPAALQARPHLIGGEAVVLQGLHHTGRLRFRLPTLRLSAWHRFVDRTARSKLRLDGVLIDVSSDLLTMYFRHALPASRVLVRHQETLLRLLEPWEAVRSA